MYLVQDPVHLVWGPVYLVQDPVHWVGHPVHLVTAVK